MLRSTPAPFPRSIFIFAAFILVLAGAAFFFLFSPSLPQQHSSIEDCIPLVREYPLPPSVFAQLPPPPLCFMSFARAFHSGQFSDLAFFSPAFYLQPEFYPGFRSEGLVQWTNPSPTHYGAIGVGSFPLSSTLDISPGETKTVRFFLYSGFGVRSLQGVRLDATPLLDLPPSVQISLDSNARAGFLLTPAFPQFTPAWARPVDITIALAPNAPFGEMEVDISTAPVSAALFESDPRLETTPYFDSTDFIGPRRVFRLTIRSR